MYTPKNVMSHQNLTKSCLQEYAVEPSHHRNVYVILYGLALTTLVPEVQKMQKLW